MIVWTIHQRSVWQEVQNAGVLSCPFDHEDEFFGDAYDWMSDQLRSRIGAPPADVKWPVWVWYQYGNGPKRRPDLRTIRHQWTTGESVMLECELDDDQVLLSDFNAWHCVLNDWYLPLSETDNNRFDKRCRKRNSEPQCTAERRASWERVFDIHYFDSAGTDFHTFDDPFEKRYIQGTTWEIRLDQVRSVRPFQTTKVFRDGGLVSFEPPMLSF